MPRLLGMAALAIGEGRLWLLGQVVLVLEPANQRPIVRKGPHWPNICLEMLGFCRDTV
jgi:hypothetical protein